MHHEHTGVTKVEYLLIFEFDKILTRLIKILLHYHWFPRCGSFLVHPIAVEERVERAQRRCIQGVDMEWHLRKQRVSCAMIFVVVAIEEQVNLTFRFLTIEIANHQRRINERADIVFYQD